MLAPPQKMVTIIWLACQDHRNHNTALETLSIHRSRLSLSVNLLLQHIHTCLWPHLISPFLKLATRHASSEPHPPTQPKHQQRAEEDATNGGMPRVELNVKLNNVSLVLLDKPSDMTSYGVCAEVKEGEMERVGEGGREGGRERGREGESGGGREGEREGGREGGREWGRGGRERVKEEGKGWKREGGRERVGEGRKGKSEGGRERVEEGGQGWEGGKEKRVLLTLSLPSRLFPLLLRSSARPRSSLVTQNCCSQLTLSSLRPA